MPIRTGPRPSVMRAMLTPGRQPRTPKSLSAPRGRQFVATITDRGQHLVAYTLAVFAAGALRRLTGRRRTSRSTPEEKPPTRIVVVSNVSSFGGGGVVDFRDILSAIRRKRPDVHLVAVLPRKGDVSQRCAGDGIET